MTAEIEALAARIREQLDADEAAARDLAAWADGSGRADGGSYDFGRLLGDRIRGPFGGQSAIRNWGTGRDVARFADPPSVLRRVARTRKHVDLLLAEPHADSCPYRPNDPDEWPCECRRDTRVLAYLQFLADTEPTEHP